MLYKHGDGRESGLSLGNQALGPQLTGRARWPRVYLHKNCIKVISWKSFYVVQEKMSMP